MKQMSRFIPAGKIVNTHGVRGEVKIEVWLDSPAFLAQFPRIFVNGSEYRLLSSSRQKQFLLARLEGIDDVNAAMTLKGKEIQIAREDADLPEGGYFLQDLLGARVVTEEGEEIGTLQDVMERPASDIYVVIDKSGNERLIPAVPEFIRSVDPAEGVITVALIPGM